MKKIEKIRIINTPKENILNDDDLFNFMGRDNCASYDNSTCPLSKYSECSEYNVSPCDDEAQVKCAYYMTDSPTT